MTLWLNELQNGYHPELSFKPKHLMHSGNLLKVQAHEPFVSRGVKQQNILFESIILPSSHFLLALEQASWASGWPKALTALN